MALGTVHLLLRNINGLKGGDNTCCTAGILQGISIHCSYYCRRDLQPQSRLLTAMLIEWHESPGMGA